MKTRSFEQKDRYSVDQLQVRTTLRLFLDNRQWFLRYRNKIKISQPPVKSVTLAVRNEHEYSQVNVFSQSSSDESSSEKIQEV